MYIHFTLHTWHFPKVLQKLAGIGSSIPFLMHSRTWLIKFLWWLHWMVCCTLQARLFDIYWFIISFPSILLLLSSWVESCHILILYVDIFSSVRLQGKVCPNDWLTGADFHYVGQMRLTLLWLLEPPTDCPEDDFSMLAA